MFANWTYLWDKAWYRYVVDTWARATVVAACVRGRDGSSRRGRVAWQAPAQGVPTGTPGGSTHLGEKPLRALRPRSPRCNRRHSSREDRLSCSRL